MWNNRFRENENEAVEAHIPQHQDSKTKKPRNSKIKKPLHRDTGAKTIWHQEIKTIKTQHEDSQAFFQWKTSTAAVDPRYLKVEVPE